MESVYILTSLKDPARIYIGRTTNLEARLKDHNSGKTQSTKDMHPWKLETHITFSNSELAVKFEKYLKQGSGFAFLKKRFLPK